MFAPRAKVVGFMAPAPGLRLLGSAPSGVAEVRLAADDGGHQQLEEALGRIARSLELLLVSGSESERIPAPGSEAGPVRVLYRPRVAGEPQERFKARSQLGNDDGGAAVLAPAERLVPQHWNPLLHVGSD